jgi:hypothetical protein
VTSGRWDCVYSAAGKLSDHASTSLSALSPSKGNPAVAGEPGEGVEPAIFEIEDGAF